MGTARRRNQEKKHEHEQEQRNTSPRAAPAFGDGSPGSLVLTLRCLQDGVDARRQSALKITRLEAGFDFLFDDGFGERIGNGPFKAISDLEEYLAVLDEDEQHRSVVGAFSANSPGLGNSESVILDGGS